MHVVCEAATYFIANLSWSYTYYKAMQLDEKGHQVEGLSMVIKMEKERRYKPGKR